MVISKLLKLEFPFFVVVAAIISMENSLANSFKAGKNRMLGTFIGAGMGMVCALIRPGSAILSGIGIIAVIFLCNLFKWRKSVPIAGIVFIAVMVSLQGKDPVLYSINRIFDTFIGIVVAVAVNYLVFPPDYVPKIRRIILELMAKTQRVMGEVFVNREKVSLVEYDQEVVKANKLLELACMDNRILKRRNVTDDLPGLRKNLDQFTEVYRHLRIISQINQAASLNESNAREIQNIMGWNDLPRPSIAENEIDIVFNYHVQKVLSLYQSCMADDETSDSLRKK